MTIRSVVTEELARITEEQGGHLTPEAVVAAARPKSSPLHTLFEWDNKIAGEKYRRLQARTLIRVVVKEIGEEDDGRRKFVRAYYPASRAGRDEKGYLPTETIVQSPVSTAILLRALRREIGALKTRYSHLEEFAAIVREELSLDVG